MANVKIFVSHRVDQDNLVLENSIYTPVRCGAYFDENKNPVLLGDNTGTNISDKRSYLGEITVQYWAWKNVEADYYGLCHYRRYLSFADKKYPTDEKNQVIEKWLTPESFEKYGLNDTKRISKIVSKYDAVVAEYADISGMWTPRGPRPTVYDHFTAYHNHLIDKADINLFLDTMEELYPEYNESAREYFAGSKFRGYNCFILKKEYFFKLCEMEMAIMKAIDKSGKVDFKSRSSLQIRTYGFFTEWVYGIFLYHMEKNHAKIKYTQLVFFERTSNPKYVMPQKDRIPVVFEANRYILPVVQVAIQSILQAKKADTKYDILICHEELDEHICKRTKAFFEADKTVSLRFVDLKSTAPRSSTGVVWNYARTPSHALYLMPWILRNYKKILFFHADVLVCSDLTELFETKLNGKMLAAVRDYHRVCENRHNSDVYDLRKHKLSIENPDDFFSTAVMVMDLETIRNQMDLDTCIRYSIGNYSCRDATNRLYSGQVKLLNEKWNVCPAMNGEVEQLDDFMLKTHKDSYTEAEKDPAIIHFQANPKPWQNPFHPWSVDFWDVARQIPLYEQLLTHCCVSCVPHQDVPYPVPYYPAPAPVTESLPRRIAGKLLPKGSARRDLVKKILPKKGSPVWNFFKRFYHSVFKH